MQVTIGFGWIAILLIALKLGGVIAWSWWLILLPLYAPALLGLIVITLAITFGVLEWQKLAQRHRTWNRWR